MDQPFVERLDQWVVTHRAQRRHIQHAAHLRPTAPGHPLPAELPAVAVQRSHAHQLADLPMGQCSELWQGSHQARLSRNANTLESFEQRELLGEVFFKLIIHVTVNLRQLLIDHLPNGLATRMLAWMAARQAVVPWLAHLNELSTTTRQGL